MSNNFDRTAGGVQSVDRAISVLEALARTGEAGVSAIATEISVHKSTAFRLLAALEARGLVEQSGHRGKYRLGFGLIPLAGAVTDRLDVVRLGHEICIRLAAEMGETVNLAVLQEHYAVNVDQARGPSTVTTHNWIGRLTPVHCTSSGKVLLAHLDPDWRRRLLTTGGMPALTPNTITDLDRLENELAAVRQAGHACAIEEYEIGLNAIAAPAFDRFGDAVAALSVSGPTYRMPTDRMAKLIEPLTAAAAEISRRVGFNPH